MKKKAHRLSIAVLAGLALSSSAGADVTFLNGYAGTAQEVFVSTAAESQAYVNDTSDSDLLHGLTASSVSGWNTANSATVVALTDGVHGPAGVPVAAAWASPGGADTATYYLDGVYDLSSLQSIASWGGGGLGQQAWTIEVRPVRGSFKAVATINFQALSDGNPATSADRTGGATKVNLTDLNVTGVDAIRITTGTYPL